MHETRGHRGPRVSGVKRLGEVGGARRESQGRGNPAPGLEVEVESAAVEESSAVAAEEAAVTTHVATGIAHVSAGISGISGVSGISTGIGQTVFVPFAITALEGLG